MRYGVQHARLKQAMGTPEWARGGAVALRPRFPELRFSPTYEYLFPKRGHRLPFICCTSTRRYITSSNNISPRKLDLGCMDRSRRGWRSSLPLHP